GVMAPVLSRVYLRPAPGYDAADLAAVLAGGGATSATTATGPISARAHGTTAAATATGPVTAGAHGTTAAAAQTGPAPSPSPAAAAQPGPAGRPVDITTAGPPVIGAPGVSAGWAEDDIPPPPARAHVPSTA